MATQQRVLIGDGLAHHGQDNPAKVLCLPCPQTGKPQTFVLTSCGLLEVNQFKARYSSWLVGSCVMSDGGVLLATAVDVLFVLLPLMDALKDDAGRVYQEADSLLTSDDYPGLAALASLAERALPRICDVRCMDSGERFFRFNRNKATAWLRCKVQQALSAFRSTAPACIAGLDDSGQLSYVLGYLGEYLPPKWQQLLAEQYNLEPAGVNNTAGAAAGTTRPYSQPEAGSQPSSEKKAKVDPREAARRKAEATRTETAKAKFAKASYGTKKISNFFCSPAAKHKRDS